MTAERNTPRDIVFDMEGDIGDLRRLGSTLLAKSLIVSVIRKQPQEPAARP